MSITRTDGNWVEGHTRRRWLDKGNLLDLAIGAYGPAVVADSGQASGGDGCIAESPEKNSRTKGERAALTPERSVL